jgi:hypothetical protein
MKFKMLFAALALATSLVFVGCGPDEGLGGSSSIRFTAKHHNKAIPLTTMYIKYGAKTSPGISASDFDNAIISDAQGQGTFENLQKGDYYLYGIGWDSSITQAVSGGVPVTIKKDGDAMDVTVAITE